MAIKTRNYTVETAGTPVLVDIRAVAGTTGMVVQALATNTGRVAIGGDNVDESGEVGIMLGVGQDSNSKDIGDAVSFPGAVDFYLDAEVNGDGVSVTIV